MATPKPVNRMVEDSSTRMVSYVGHKAEVYTVFQGITFHFPNGKAMLIPTALADQLIAQSDNFKGEGG